MLLLSNTHKKLDFAHILKRIHSKMSFSYSKTIKESVKNMYTLLFIIKYISEQTKTCLIETYHEREFTISKRLFFEFATLHVIQNG